LLCKLDINPFRHAHVTGIREISPIRARAVKERTRLDYIELNLRIAQVTLSQIDLNPANSLNRAVSRNLRGLWLPFLLIKDIPDAGRGKVRAFLVLRCTRESLRVLSQPLENTDNAVNLASDPVVGRSRLLALLEYLD